MVFKMRGYLECFEDFPRLVCIEMTTHRVPSSKTDVRLSHSERIQVYMLQISNMHVKIGITRDVCSHLKI